MLQCKTIDDLMAWRSKYKIHATDNISNLLYSTYSIYLADKEIKNAIKSTTKYIKQERNVTNTVTDSLDIVLVIGESYIKSHSSLYGYYLKTCPNMEEEKKGGSIRFHRCYFSF